MRYLPNSDADRAEMLSATGHQSIDELCAQIPEELGLRELLNLPGPLSEPEVLDFFRQAASRSSREYVSLLGAGAYSHFHPVVIDTLLARASRGVPRGRRGPIGHVLPLARRMLTVTIFVIGSPWL